MQSFKNTFLSNNLDQNMHKNALFFEKNWKIAAALGAPPPDPITCYSYFLEGVCSTNVLSKRNKKNLDIAIMFCSSLISLFKLCMRSSKRHWLEFLGIVTITTYILYHT